MRRGGPTRPGHVNSKARSVNNGGGFSPRQQWEKGKKTEARGKKAHCDLTC